MNITKRKSGDTQKLEKSLKILKLYFLTKNWWEFDIKNAVKAMWKFYTTIFVFTLLFYTMYFEKKAKKLV